MSSPPFEYHLNLENERDFEKLSVWIQSVDESKPLGKLIAHYANQKWSEGYWRGLGTGFMMGLAFSGIGVALTKANRS